MKLCRPVLFVVVLAGGSLLAAACGQSGPPGAPGQPATASPVPGAPGAPATVPGVPASPVTPGVPGVPQNPFAALGQMAQAMQGVQAPNAGGVTNWRQLAEALPPQVPGWTPDGDVQGSTGAAMGFAASEARRSFSQGDRDLDFKIVDSSMNQMAAMVFNAARTVQVDSSEEVQRPADLSGNPGFMKYRNAARRAEATFMIANRYIFEIRTTGSPSPDEILQLAAYLNLARLTQLAAMPAAPVTAPAPAP
jgi:hypothetical protein